MHMDFIPAIVIARALASSMMHARRAISPRPPTSLNTVRLCLQPCPWHAAVVDARLERLGLSLGQPLAPAWTTARPPPPDGRPVWGQRPAPTWPLLATSTACAALGLAPLRLPLRASPALGRGARHRGGERPRRRCFTIP